MHNNVVKLSFGHFGVQGVMDTIESHYMQLDGGVMSCVCTCINYTYPTHNLFHYNDSLGVEIRVTEFDICIYI